jgi:hypothetical protein
MDKSAMQISYTLECCLPFPLYARPGEPTARQKDSAKVKTFRTFQPSAGRASPLLRVRFASRILLYPTKGFVGLRWLGF